MKQAVDEWLRTYPAVRLQHRPDYPVGKGLSAWQDPDGSTWLESVLVDDKAKELTRKQVLRAYSVGLADVQTRKSARAPRFEIVGGRLAEVSVCDSPSNARCGIRILGKSAGGGLEYVGKVFGKAPKPGKPGKIAKRAAARERDAVAGWLDSPDPAVREMARAFLGAGRAGSRKVTKSGTAGLSADAVALMFLSSPDPAVREMVLEALGGEHGPG